MTNHPVKGRGFAHVTHFCMLNCGLRKNYPGHQLIAINNGATTDHVLITSMALGATTLRLRPKLHRFDLSLYLLQCWLYNI